MVNQNGSIDSLFLTSAELAGVFGITASRISQLCADGILVADKLPGVRGRMFKVTDSIQRYMSYHINRNNKSDVRDRLANAKAYKEELLVMKLEHEVELAEGRLFDVDTIRCVWNDVVTSLKIRLWAFPNTVADKLVDIKSQDNVSNILRSEITSLCGLLTDFNAEDFYIRNPDKFNDDPEKDTDL